MIRLRYGLIADYAGPGWAGKPTIVGVFEVAARAPLQPGEQLHTPTHVIHCCIEAPTHLGSRQVIGLALVDADAREITSYEMAGEFIEKGDGTGSICNLFYAITRPIPLPEFGLYEWVVSMAGNRIGSIPLSMMELTPDLRAKAGLPLEDKEG